MAAKLEDNLIMQLLAKRGRDFYLWQYRMMFYVYDKFSGELLAVQDYSDNFNQGFEDG